MITIDLQKALTVAAAAVIASTLVSGCTSISQTLDRGKQAMVKMPLAVQPGMGIQRKANGIIFQQAFEAPTLGNRPATWFLAWREDGKPVLANEQRGMVAIADAAFGAWQRYPILVEENFSFKTTGRRFGPLETKTGVRPPGEDECVLCKGGGRAAVAIKGPSKVWPYRMTLADVVDWKRRHPGEPIPKFDPLWHLGDAYTQLRSAREAARLSPNGEKIRIGHLDNGFTEGHVGAASTIFPARKVFPLSHAMNCTGLAVAIQKGTLHEHPTPGETHGSHGTGSLGILAGGKVEMKPMTLKGVSIGGINEPIGGAPEAEVVPIRVAPWVGSLSSAEMAYAIDLASRVHKCQVISMSHGGLPTVAWADAINAAYERGTAIFAAESDFFSLWPRPVYPFAFIWPSSPVWPAAFRRVIGVAGVQKDGTTYAKNGGIPLTGFMRGSYGADGTQNFGIFSALTEDPQTTKYGGKLRAHPISAYAPNIVWPAVRKEKETRKLFLDGLEFDGGGTSSSTPQVAAAAALWLQKHRAGFSKEEWNSWKRAEAVYFALLKTADRRASGGKPDLYLGAGVLKAKDALAITPKAAMAAKKGQAGSEPELYFPYGVRGSRGKDFGMASDYADGERSLRAFLRLERPHNVPNNKRKNLNNKEKAGESREAALLRIRENAKLIQQWRRGLIPREDEEI